MPRFPSQQEAKDLLISFSGGGAPAKRGGLFSRPKRGPELKPGVYLDGGFGVGKTHLLAAVYHAMPARRKYFGSFIEYTALVGALGYKNTVELFRGSDLLCIDEFELDDPGDTMVMTRLLAELVGHRNAAGCDIQHPAQRPRRRPVRRAGLPARDPCDVGELPDHPDRRRGLPPPQPRRPRRGARGGARTRPPSPTPPTTRTRLGRLVRGARVAPGARAPLPLHPDDRRPRRSSDCATSSSSTDQSAALRFVAFIDRVYDAELPIRATGLSLDLVFADEMLAGGYRKKYLRAISRLVASTLA